MSARTDWTCTWPERTDSSPTSAPGTGRWGRGCRNTGLGAWLQEHPAGRVVMEATGRYHRAAHQALHARGIEVVLANPLRTRRFAEALGLLAKTDTIDAAALAAYGTAFLDLPATPPRSAFLEPLADLLVLREQHRDAQVSLRQSAAEVRDPALREEAQHSVDQLGR